MSVCVCVFARVRLQEDFQKPEIALRSVTPTLSRDPTSLIKIYHRFSPVLPRVDVPTIKDPAQGAEPR